MMHTTNIKQEWTDFLSYFGEANVNRPTRIGLFETAEGTTNDYWIEDGLPLKGIDVDFRGPMPVLEVMLEGVTHVIRNVRDLRPIYTFDGNEEGMDITAVDGTTTILRFEDC
jgi:hypothetical protein